MPTARQWLHRLMGVLAQQQKHAKTYDRYYSGESVLEIVTQDFNEVFGGKFAPVRVNLSRVVAEARMERVVLEGFTVGDADEQVVTAGQKGADAARRVWIDNDMQVMALIAHTELSVKGSAFTLTWPDDNDRPIISVEDPEQMAVARLSSPPYNIIAALKRWTDEWDGTEFAEVYLPEGVWRFRRSRGIAETGIWVPTSALAAADWADSTFDGGVEQLPNPFGEVPVVELANRQRLLKAPQSDLVDIAPLQDAHDKILADLIIAASFGAVPVRWGTGLVFATDDEGHPVDERGNRITPFDVRSDRVWISSNAASRFGTLEGSSLEGFVKARDTILSTARSLSRVPLHYFDMGGTSGVSSETLKALEAPLARWVSGTTDRLGPAWAKTMRFALSLDSTHRDKPVLTRWADTETKSMGQQGDFASKARDIGVPLEIILEEILGWPRELTRKAIAGRDAEQLRGEALLNAIRTDAINVPGAGTAEPEGVPVGAGDS